MLCCVTVKTSYTQYTHLVAQVSSTQQKIAGNLLDQF